MTVETLALALLVLLPVALPGLLFLVERRLRRRAWLSREEELSVDAQRAHKVALLLAEADGGRVLLGGITQGRAYVVDDEAACPRARCESPGLDCVCGFYALKDRSEAEDLLASNYPLRTAWNGALLTVELAGRVLQYERGYRAQYQRVLRVEIGPQCTRCLRRGEIRRATAVGGRPVERREVVLGGSGRLHEPAARVPLRPVCPDHTPEGDDAVVLDLAELANRLGTEVVWRNARRDVPSVLAPRHRPV